MIALFLISLIIVILFIYFFSQNIDNFQSGECEGTIFNSDQNSGFCHAADLYSHCFYIKKLVNQNKAMDLYDYVQNQYLKKGYRKPQGKLVYCYENPENKDIGKWCEKKKKNQFHLKDDNPIIPYEDNGDLARKLVTEIKKNHCKTSEEMTKLCKESFDYDQSLNLHDCKENCTKSTNCNNDRCNDICNTNPTPWNETLQNCINRDKLIDNVVPFHLPKVTVDLVNIHSDGTKAKFLYYDYCQNTNNNSKTSSVTSTTSVTLNNTIEFYIFYLYKTYKHNEGVNIKKVKNNNKNHKYIFYKDLEPNETYSLFIKPYNNDGFGEKSNTITFLTSIKNIKDISTNIKVSDYEVGDFIPCSSETNINLEDNIKVINSFKK